jgi:two-component system, NarL family, sensor histidine kinase DesK
MVPGESTIGTTQGGYRTMRSLGAEPSIRDSRNPPPGEPSISGVVYELPGWAHYIWLIYLGFVFSPALSGGRDWLWLWPTLASLPVFLYLYRRIIREFRHKIMPGPSALPAVLAIAVIAYALAYFNESANTYLIYCVAIVPFTSTKVWRVALLVLAMLGIYGLELLVLGFKPMTYWVTCIVGMAAAASNYVLVQNRRKNAMLRLSREEIHRLGRVAERERIGRDLHDLLGHTLSLIAIKSELAVKLMDRDRAAAAREVAEVTSIARDALRQVRTAVTGIRSAALENEVASARTLLDTAGVALGFERDGGVLSPEIETALAMIVREAATNIHRHSSAQNTKIDVRTQTVVTGASGAAGEKMVFLTISDDGRGGVTTSGNGLSGIGERVRSLGGTLEIESPRGQGTKLRVRLPLLASDFRVSSAPNLPESLAASDRAISVASSPEVSSSRQTAATEAESSVVSAVVSVAAPVAILGPAVAAAIDDSAATAADVELETLSPVVRP